MRSAAYCCVWTAHTTAPGRHERGNHVAFVCGIRHGLSLSHSGKMALMHDGGVVEIVDDKDVAYELGLRRYGDGNFSLERIGASPHSFGVLACAFQ